MWVPGFHVKDISAYLEYGRLDISTNLKETYYVWEMQLPDVFCACISDISDGTDLSG
jgi:hypothetical protein